MNHQQAAQTFAQALLDNENSQRCEFCETGYCYGNHEPDCVIMKAKEYLEENNERP